MRWGSAVRWQPDTIDSWSRTRRVVGKAEHTLEGANLRFIVTSLKRSRVTNDACAFYAQFHWVHGEAEGRSPGSSPGRSDVSNYLKHVPTLAVIPAESGNPD